MTVSAGRVREIVVDATEEALNQALAREQIAPEKIITVTCSRDSTSRLAIMIASGDGDVHRN